MSLDDDSTGSVSSSSICFRCAMYEQASRRVSSLDSLVSAGTQGRVVFSREKALLSTRIRSLSRALADGRGLPFLWRSSRRKASSKLSSDLGEIGGVLCFFLFVMILIYFNSNLVLNSTNKRPQSVSILTFIDFR